MKKAHIKKIITYIIYISIGALFLLGGIVYSRYEREGFDGISNLSHLLSQSVPNEEATKPAVPTMTKEEITARITELEKEILQETNDPIRDIHLRTELFTMKAQLAGLSK